VAVDRISQWETDLLRSLETTHPEILADIAERKIITDENRAKLASAIEDFNRTWGA
jgi:F-type H+-transporting ATPase subunit alpha